MHFQTQHELYCRQALYCLTGSVTLMDFYFYFLGLNSAGKMKLEIVLSWQVLVICSQVQTLWDFDTSFVIVTLF